MYPLHSNNDTRDNTFTEDDRKLPFDLAATTIKQLMSEVLPKKLELLTQHNKNIQKACEIDDHAKANQEILRASLIVKQIERELVNLDKLKQRLKVSDHQTFDKMVNEPTRKAAKVLQDFYELKRKQRSVESNYKEEKLEESRNPQLQLQVLEHPSELEQAEAYAQSLEEVQKDCQHIHETYRMLSKYVTDSAEQVNAVEDNIVSTEEHVQKAERHLAYCARKNLAFYPLIGAAVGACVGGPIGLLVGAKVAVAAALGGGVVGITGARVIKKKKLQDIQDIDEKVKSNQS